MNEQPSSGAEWLSFSRLGVGDRLARLIFGNGHSSQVTIRLVVVVPLALLVVGLACAQPDPTPTNPSPTVSPTMTPTVPIPTPTATSFPTTTPFPTDAPKPAATASPVPTATLVPTPIPTQVPTPAPTLTPIPVPTLVPTPTPTPDTTPPSAITGLVVWDAYDGKINLVWDQSTAEDFGRYNVYFAEAEIADIAGLTPVQQIQGIATTSYQLTGLEDATKYYFAVTAVDDSGNEDRHMASVSGTPTVMPAGTPDPDISLEVYRSDKAWAGTTLLADEHTRGRPRIIEVNMRGEIIWEYVLPDNLKRYTSPGFDVEWLPNNNILFVLPAKGVYEINRGGSIVWSYLDSKISHDADRLPNGNTIFAFGDEDTALDAQVKEVSPEGRVVWSWYANDHFKKAPYEIIYDNGWTHTNAVIRLSNGNTIISPRNFNFLIEVDPQGTVVRTIGEGILKYQHDPEVLPNGNILVANHRRPHAAIEIDPETGQILWRYVMRNRETWPVRDADRMPNGNTLITGATTLLEVTSEGEIVWQFSLKGVTGESPKQRAASGFYKAERVIPSPTLFP